MQVNIVKLSSWRIPRQFIHSWMKDVCRELHKEKAGSLKGLEITVAFVDKKEIRRLNQDFRSKTKVTDILSFSPIEDGSLGELAIYGEQVDAQAEAHELSRREELGYLLIHGTLHLLGYEHEQGGAAEKRMFSLQDRVFARLQKRYF